MWDHTVLPATRHRWMPDRLVLDLPIPKGWKAELTFVLVIYWYGLPVCRESPIQVVSMHLLATQLGIEPATSHSQSQHANRYTLDGNCWKLGLILYCTCVSEREVDVSVADNDRLWRHEGQLKPAAVDVHAGNSQFRAQFRCGHAQSVPKTLDHRARS